MDNLSSVIHITSTTMTERKSSIITILRSSSDFVSGESMSSILGVSRNSIHKHVNSLRKRGFRIVGISRRGYRLQSEPDVLSMDVVAELTKNSLFGQSLRHYDELDSTSREARCLALQGAPEGCVVIAESGSFGRSRCQQPWTSPSGKGLLFSVILRPTVQAHDAQLIALSAVVAVADAVESQAAVPTSIKWPGEIFVNEKKAGAVTTQLTSQGENIDWLTLGVTLDVNTSFLELPVPLRRSATSLAIATGRTIDRSQLLATTLLSMEHHYIRALAHGFDRTLAAFRQRDYLLRRSVVVQAEDGSVAGIASGVDARGALLVELPERRVRCFDSCDVLLRP